MKQLYIGTFSDKSLVNTIREIAKQNSGLYMGQDIASLNDDDIIKQYVITGKCPGALTNFFADNLNHAYQQANDMGLKNFSRVSNKVYTVKIK